MLVETSQNNKEEDIMAGNSLDPDTECVSDSNRSDMLEAGPITPVIPNYLTNDWFKDM